MTFQLREATPSEITALIQGGEVPLGGCTTEKFKLTGIQRSLLAAQGNIVITRGNKQTMISPPPRR